MPQNQLLSFSTKLLLIGALGLFLLIFSLESSAHALEKKSERMSLFEVPTTGKIMDVEFRPEFDEWWVKCREGENISVYTFDRRANKWGRVQFMPRKADAKTHVEEPEKPAIPQSAPAPKPPEPVKPPETKPEPTKPPEQKKTETRWWDPLNVFKGGERLIKSLEGK
ncbi:hypothetical protein [Desulfomonile tiedjei]|uniref:Uncharacterized protein n=1 Tax=Desulfomonile tiedjei (strain ATCC 49306 / DSM 6799 / DCB-1) TaxID=706587 RepID=I4C4A5_DESTA|nr:hypothetical protein [Desulfomonile tiedjei]AFM24396.1 hypothetical protein Desti_1685 [Desulfomonile tiedjei DSM 6799]